MSPGGGVDVLLIAPGPRFDIYFDPNPNQDWADPSTFSDGQLIATFEESAFLGTSIGGVAYNAFSNDLVGSESFVYQGTEQDFEEIFPNGVTITNFSSSTPISFDPLAFGFTGVATAIGESSDDQRKRR